ncbi:alpha/beta fold hydrolase [Flavobacterium circumlabens]|uniref:Alpha/beta fold hydrolase n=1 Tax=Flavobacterium circumlabens TaxID=2133765 RepID=A0A4Y7UAT0_9FLAO|nr:alpha/beta fold hydrolase [Flavobacterium circumlabens]TCN55440.1 alpha/beta hydrolase family protein [Flavobacterium circumlabens]TEB43148.1 alpha/beta fold hydrolase [Flavobacterium circumlabens]
MKNLVRLFLLLCLLPTCLFAQTAVFKFEKTTTFFPEQKAINQDNIEWGYLTVPENWDKPEGKKIKMAVAVLKSTSKKADANPVIYIEGGPGAGGIKGIWGWLKHPLRSNSTIILADVRGTGFSFPKFCPDLGKKFLEILAKNQNATQDEQQKTIAAAACKQDLLNRDIDINAYNSKSIAKDLNALKKALGYTKWNAYGVSYGTYTAQIYANDFPEDIQSLILDSSVSDISNYYNQNTTNYVNSLEKVFNACKNDPNCNKQYPYLENVYYETLEKLEKNPITVKVDQKIIPAGAFTYNAEDFKISIQQALYQKKLIELLPLLITEFNRGNKNTLSALVAAFSGALGLDYGQYYCVSCKETVPNNSISAFNANAAKYKKLQGGLSFYKSDFSVCDKWNQGSTIPLKSSNDLSNLSAVTAPVLVLAGAFDPITPASNGKVTVNRFKNGFLVNAPVFGHAPGFSKIGAKIIEDFVSNPNKKPDVSGFQSVDKVNFITDVKLSGGVSNFANSLNGFTLLFFAPFLIAFVILLVSIFGFIYSFIKKEIGTKPNIGIRILILITALLGLFTVIGFILAINNTAQDNFYILAFGIRNQFDYLFIVQWFFIVFTLFSILYFAFKIKSISNAGVISTILFSFILVGVYFQYWGFLF